MKSFAKALLPLSMALALSLHAREEAHASEPLWVDDYYEAISRRVVEWSDAVDRTLYDWLAAGEESEKAPASPVERERRHADAFFQTRKYLNESRFGYIRLRFVSALQSRDPDSLDVKARLHLPLSKTRRRLRLFLEDLNDDNAGELTRRSETPEESTPRFGINYFAPRAFGVISKYSLGLAGLYPYVRARYSLLLEKGSLLVEPVQTFQYSAKSHFSESTVVYFDTRPSAFSLVRLRLERGTRAHKEGMAYGGGLSYSHEFSDARGVRLFFEAAGETRYEEDDGTHFNGLYNYTVGAGWRMRLWRTWLYLEAIPSVNYHREYRYHPNYAFRFLVDIFFGHYE